MSTTFGNGTRLTGVQDGLRAVIDRYQNAVIFGYGAYPGVDQCSAGEGCCAGESIDPAPGTLASIRTKLSCTGAPSPMADCVSSSGSRPIGAAFRAANSSFDFTEMTNRHLVLLADGDPSCGVQEECSKAKNERTGLANNSVKVWVVHVGDDTQNDNCLWQLADQSDSGGLRRAPDPSSLSARLEDVLSTVAASYCIINLKNTSDRSSVSLYIRDRPITKGGPNGWDFVAGQPHVAPQIQVSGSACKDLQAAPESSIFVYGCP